MMHAVHPSVAEVEGGVAAYVLTKQTKAGRAVLRGGVGGSQCRTVKSSML
jgi:hypothetical protein